MKIFRYEFQGEVKYGILEEEYLRELECSPFENIRPGKTKVKISEVRILVPSQPSKVVCLAYNFRAHAQEMGKKVPEEPVFFFKPPSSLIAHLEPIKLPEKIGRVDFGGELAVVVKERFRNLPVDFEFEKYILGFTIINDITARDIANREGPFGKAKAFDTFTPAGPCILRGDKYRTFKLKAFLNSKIKQSSSMSNMIFPVNYSISYLSNIMTFEPGDIISFGTPGGVDEIKPGDRIDVQIEEIGILSNPVIKEVNHEDIP